MKNNEQNRINNLLLKQYSDSPDFANELKKDFVLAKEFVEEITGEYFSTRVSLYLYFDEKTGDALSKYFLESKGADELKYRLVSGDVYMDLEELPHAPINNVLVEDLLKEYDRLIAMRAANKEKTAINEVLAEPSISRVRKI